MKTLLILSLLLISIGVKAQTKIGNITISDEKAMAYFLDCYNRPDTVAASDEYNSRDFVKYSIGKLYEHYHFDAHIDTLYDGEPKQTYVMNNLPLPKITPKTKITYQKVAVEDGHYFIGYSIPSKPSETDYIKYLKRTGKLQ